MGDAVLILLWLAGHRIASHRNERVTSRVASCHANDDIGMSHVCVYEYMFMYLCM